MFDFLSFRRLGAASALASALLALSVAAQAAPQHHAHARRADNQAAMRPVGASVIYCIYPSIFSPKGDLNGVQAQLGRLKRLGIDIVWLMPITPIGQAVGSHPAFGSPYSVENYYSINPQYGDAAALHSLVSAAHAMGMRVILDEVLNHTSWDNPLIHKHPEFYVHSDGDASDPGSIKQAFNYADVAQLNYSNPQLWSYMDGMLDYWIKQYDVDGFRFDSANNPDGPKRMIPAPFWRQLGAKLYAAKPDVVLLGECETPDLAEKPFQIDYGWQMYGAQKSAAGGDAQALRSTWEKQTNDFPPGMLHMNVQDDWDMPRDVSTFGSPAGAQAAAAFDFTINGVPLVYNGMEVGNAAEAVNPHAPIDWSAGNPQFSAFYEKLIALRHANPALQQGALTWLSNSAPSQVATYLRSGKGTQFLVTINFSGQPATGSVEGVPSGKWVNVTPSAPTAQTKSGDPAHYDLPAKGFAIYSK